MKRIATAVALSLALTTPMWGDAQPSAPLEAGVGYMLATYLGVGETGSNLVSAAAGAAAAWRGARIGAALGGTIGGFAGVVVGAAVGAA